MSFPADMAEVLTGQPGRWLFDGALVTAAVSIAAGLTATMLGVLLFALRIGVWTPGRLVAGAVIGAIRNSPLLVQLLFWYFAAWGLLPQALRDALMEGPWQGVAIGGVSLTSPEWLTAVFGLGVFFAAFLAEELRAGFLSVPPGQALAARAQGLAERDVLLAVVLPQALGAAWQPMIGQYLNLMKFSSLAAAIGLAELTYAVRQVESFNARAFEAIAVGTIIYLVFGLAAGRVLTALKPAWAGRVKAADVP